MDELKASVSMNGPMGKVTLANGFKDPKKVKEPGLAHQETHMKANGSKAKLMDLVSTHGQTGTGMKAIGRTVLRKGSELNIIVKQGICIRVSSNVGCLMDMEFTNMKIKLYLWES